MGTENLGYVEPGVRVYQIIANLNSALADIPLTPVLVGACYKVVDRELILPFGTFTNDVHHIPMPKLPPGGIIQHDSIILHVTGKAVIDDELGVGYEVGSVWFKRFERGSKYVPLEGCITTEALRPGDKIVLDDSWGDYTIESVSGNGCYLKETIVHSIDADPPHTIGATIYRDYSDYAFSGDDLLDILSVGALEITLENLAAKLNAQGSFPFIEGSVTLSYTALRRDLVGRYKVDSQAALQAMMDTDIKNPLGFLAAQAINASTVSPESGRVLYLYVTGEDTAEAIQAAVAELSYPGIYYLVPIIGGKDIANSYMQYVVARTQPELGEYMAAMVSPVGVLPIEDTAVEFKVEDGGAGVVFPYELTTDDNVNFIKSVRPGDYVEIDAPPNWMAGSEKYYFDFIRVHKVTGEKSLQVTAYRGNSPIVVNPSLGVDGPDVSPGTKYKIKRYFTKDQQVDYLVAVASGYNSNRTHLIWPPVALWHDSEGELVDLGAQSIAACYAAAKTAYPAQQGFTNMPFPGPYQLKYSNDYFNRQQLNRLSASGWAVFVQDFPGGAISCRHQLVSDGTEATIVQQIDKVSIDVKTMLKPFIGVYNITGDLLSALSGTIDGYLFEAVNRKADRCGSLIQGYEGPILRARLNGQNTDLPPTTIECRINISFGYPLNNIELIIRGE